MDIQSLRKKLSEKNLPYAQVGLVEASEAHQVKGVGFFPVARGIWQAEDDNFSAKPIMVLGQDFGTQAYVDLLDKDKGEEVDKNPTWRNLRSLLQKAGQTESDCFFTNAFMGLRAGNKMTGRLHTAFSHKNFLTTSRQFFLEQVGFQRPGLILALGFSVVEFLREDLSAQLTENWKNHKGIFSIIEQENVALQCGVTFDGLPGYRTNVLAVLHPSFRSVNEAKLISSGVYNENTESDRIIKALDKCSIQ